MQPAGREPTAAELADGVRAGDRTSIGRAITLVESTRPEHRVRAAELLDGLVGETGAALRIGVTGVPGVGKSTFIDSFGTMLTAAGHRVAVLAVDPSSSRSGGSILGDKTRMARLATDPAAFIRPSPARGSLGGVTRSARETLLVLEAAGYDVVIVETVGVGQSETIVAEMVDFFLVLMLPGAGDELQGIKKGVLELADLIAVNKADGDNLVRARHAVRDYQAALRLLTPTSATWQPRVMACSGQEGEGLDVIWQQIRLHRDLRTASGEWEAHRREQLLGWMWAIVDDRLGELLRGDARVSAVLHVVEAEVRDRRLAPGSAADRLLALFRSAS
jgi:LAO/AO transport system kinase